jgi:hypothetical protein
VSARGAAFGDIFNDGHIDVVLNNIDAAPTLLRNVANNGNHWLEVKLVSSQAAVSRNSPYRSSRDAIGATVFLTAAGVRQRADVFSGGSYGSSSDPRVHFGLGTLSKIDKLEIRWPSGAVEEISAPGIDHIITIIEGKGIQP